MTTESIESKTNSNQKDSDSRISFFAMIADPIRHAIIDKLLFASELSVNELIDILDKPQTLISYHLRCLRECGILSIRKSDEDGRKTLYSLHDHKFIVNFFNMADNFLKKHEVCGNHPYCRLDG